MDHTDLALLADLALGGPSAHEETRQTAERHLSACPRCRDMLTALRRIVETVRSTSPDDRVTTPPEPLWKAIAAELALGSGEPQTALLQSRRVRRARLDRAAAVPTRPAGSEPQPQDGA